jgi:hypothetical protein
MRLAALLLLGFIMDASHAAPAAPAATHAKAALEIPALRSIAGWLRTQGSPGFLGADVADAIGLRRAEADEAMAARQRGFRNEEVLRIAQVPAGGEHDFVLFMVQRPGEVFFYFSTLREGLKKAFVSIPGKNLVAPLEPYEAERNFRAELLYWEDKAATR